MSKKQEEFFLKENTDLGQFNGNLVVIISMPEEYDFLRKEWENLTVQVVVSRTDPSLFCFLKLDSKLGKEKDRLIPVMPVTIKTL